MTWCLSRNDFRFIVGAVCGDDRDKQRAEQSIRATLEQNAAASDDMIAQGLLLTQAPHDWPHGLSWPQISMTQEAMIRNLAAHPFHVAQQENAVDLVCHKNERDEKLCRNGMEILDAARSVLQPLGS